MTHAGRAASSPEIFRPFLTICLIVFPFEFRPRTFTIGFYGKKSFISELMILECSFPLTFEDIRAVRSPARAILRPLCPAPVRPGCLFCLFLSLLSPSYQPPIDRVSPNVALKLVTKPILLNRLSGLSD